MVSPESTQRLITSGSPQYCSRIIRSREIDIGSEGSKALGKVAERRSNTAMCRSSLCGVVVFQKQDSLSHHKSPDVIVAGAHLVSPRFSGVVVQASLCRPQEDIKGRTNTDWSPETYLPECHLRLMYGKQRCYLLTDNRVLQAILSATHEPAAHDPSAGGALWLMGHFSQIGWIHFRPSPGFGGR